MKINVSPCLFAQPLSLHSPQSRHGLLLLSQQLLLLRHRLPLPRQLQLLDTSQDPLIASIHQYLVCLLYNKKI